MNFVFNNLLGAPYRGGTLVIHDNELLTPVGNRVGQVNLTESTSKCLPFENLTQIRTLCVSPDGTLLMSVDKDGRALLINRKRQTLLHHFSFKSPVACARFSPDGRYIAVAVGRLVQVWVTPSLDKQMNPMQLHRTYGQCHTDVLDLAWSPDGAFIAAASRDITLRVFSLDPIPGYEPPTLAGHKEAIVRVFFASPEALAKGTSTAGEPAPAMYSLSADGALHGWTYAASAAYTLDNLAPHRAKRRRQEQAQAAEAEAEAEQGEGEEGAGDAAARRRQPGASTSAGAGAGGEEGAPAGSGRPGAFPWLAGGKWYLSAKHYLQARGARVSAADWHPRGGLLAVGYTSGVFDLLSLPDAAPLHSLSIGRERLTALAFNGTGDWLAVGCARLGQLLVWEWRSETYVLKQQGHAHDIATVAFSPDGALIATGADDCKVKVFQQSSGFCFVTFADHTAPVTGLAFAPAGHALLSSSLDGSVRAWDLVRYRCFRTLTAPHAVQLGCVAVDPAGEVVAAGAVDTFQVYVWSLKTGRLTDVLAGHEGPVAGLAFCPGSQLLASASWDRTVRTWDVYGGGGGGGGGGAAADSLEHRHEVMALAVRGDGRLLASAALDGSIYLWDPVEGVLQGTIEGRRDIRGGRLHADRRAASNAASDAAFSSLAFSADGALLLAGGNSKYVCVYDVAERLLLRRFQLSHNRSLDGVLDALNSRALTDAGPLTLVDHQEDDPHTELLPPTTDPAAAADVPGTGSAASAKRPPLRCRCVALSPGGRAWAAASTEGLLLYALDEGAVFDPTDLDTALTPAAARAALASGQPLRALLLALRLGEPGLVRHVVLATPPAAVGAVAAGLPGAFVPTVLAALAEAAADCPHLEFLLGWVRAVAGAHGAALQAAGGGGGGGGGVVAARLAGAARGGVPAGSVAPALRSLQKVLGRLHGDLAAAAEANLYALDYLTAAAGMAAEEAQAAEADVAGPKQAGGPGSKPGAMAGESRGGKAGGKEKAVIYSLRSSFVPLAGPVWRSATQEYCAARKNWAGFSLAAGFEISQRSKRLCDSPLPFPTEPERLSTILAALRGHAATHLSLVPSVAAALLHTVGDATKEGRWQPLATAVQAAVHAVSPMPYACLSYLHVDLRAEVLAGDGPVLRGLAEATHGFSAAEVKAVVAAAVAGVYVDGEEEAVEALEGLRLRLQQLVADLGGVIDSENLSWRRLEEATLSRVLPLLDTPSAAQELVRAVRGAASAVRGALGALALVSALWKLYRAWAAQARALAQAQAHARALAAGLQEALERRRGLLQEMDWPSPTHEELKAEAEELVADAAALQARLRPLAAADLEAAVTRELVSRVMRLAVAA
ncbi:hypothetical protein HYH03_009054 [Edaphochlamys debaryana]|uniref:Small-subunit processome Utp12 domain-containing protein n=1 Tax=Edaphochlamys debaryana TaxID=47281 RepID=A0A835Y0Y3_9CHLO|nr:hypothetical protein HYH03_009054 [Edaphochlamys debaryana]|eukprot:KAG2492638.1 hypothetical protein HYH03_009054 [Edaphochlamys debaryana]